MTTGRWPRPTSRLREEIARAARAGANLEELEHAFIEGAPLSREQRDALWLYAWSLAERRDASLRARGSAL